MTDEEAVVAHAQADDHVELAARAVEQLGLRDRVADRLEVARPYLLLVLEADFLLRHAAVLARDRRDFKAVALQDCAEDARQVDEADAGRDADLLEAHLARELADLLDPGPLAIQWDDQIQRLWGDIGGKRLPQRRIERDVQAI